MMAKSTTEQEASESPTARDTCRFCGGEMTHATRVENVSPHAHRGTRVTSLTCEDCGGTFHVFTRETTRRTARTRPKRSGICWEIPDGWVLVTCTECGGICDDPDTTDESNRELFEKLVNGDLRSDCCAAPVEYHRDQFGRDADGRVWG